MSAEDEGGLLSRSKVITLLPQKYNPETRKVEPYEPTGETDVKTEFERSLEGLEGDDRLKAILDLDDQYKKIGNRDSDLKYAKLFVGSNLYDKSEEEAFRFVNSYLKEHFGFDDSAIKEVKAYCSKKIKVYASLRKNEETSDEKIQDPIEDTIKEPVDDHEEKATDDENKSEQQKEDFIHLPNNPDFTFTLRSERYRGSSRYTMQVYWKGQAQYPFVYSNVSPLAKNKDRDKDLLDIVLKAGGFDKNVKADKEAAKNIIGAIPDAVQKFLAVKQKKDEVERKLKQDKYDEEQKILKEERSRVIISTNENVVKGAESASITFRYDNNTYYSAELKIGQESVRTLTSDMDFVDWRTLFARFVSFLTSDYGVSRHDADLMMRTLGKLYLDRKRDIESLNPVRAQEIEFQNKLEFIKKLDPHAGLDENGVPTWCENYVPKHYSLWSADKKKDVGACGAVLYSHENPFTGEWEEDNICDCKLMVSGYFKGCDSGNDMIELSFSAPNTDTKSVELRTIVVAYECIKSHKKFEAEVIPKGVAVESANIKHVIKYISACIRSNYDVTGSKLKTESAYEALGWKGEKFHTFNSGERLYVYDYVDECYKFNSCLFADVENTEVHKKMTTAGTLEASVEYLTYLMQHQRLHALIYKTFDVLLIKMLNAHACTICIEYDSSHGKTLAMKAAGSTMGHPQKLLLPGDTSVTAVVARMKANGDHPLFIDDTVNMSEEVKKVLGYIATNGLEPDRGFNTGKLRGTKELYSNVFISSETPIISTRAQNGANNRVIVITTPIFPELEQMKILECEDGMLENHGHILPLFLDKIAKYRHLLKGWYTDKIDELQRTTSDRGLKRQAAYYASAYVAGLMLEEIFKEIGLPTFDAAETVQQMWEECALCRTETLGDKALRTVFNTFLIYKGKNIVVGKNVKPTELNGDVYGYFNGEYLDINEKIVDKALRDDQFTTPESIKREWRHKGAIKTNSKDSYIYSAKHWTKGDETKQSTYNCIRFNVHKIYEILGIDESVVDDYDNLTEEEQAELQKSIKDLDAAIDAHTGLQSKRKMSLADQINSMPSKVPVTTTFPAIPALPSQENEDDF